MKWRKSGRIFTAEDGPAWMASHAQIPTVLDLGDKLRAYVAYRPRPGFSLTTFLDLDREDPSKVLHVHEGPILDPGPPGSFDAHGIMPQAVTIHDEQVWLYYSGWSRRVDIPYSNWTGLAVSDDDGTTFRKMFPGPIVDRTPTEIYSATGCCVLRTPSRWHMWYASGVDWHEIDGRQEELYTIKHASSSDGVCWARDDRVLLPDLRTPEPKHRPAVVQLGDTYHMWFCYRGIEGFRDGSNSYRIGYASSSDLDTWNRDDAAAGLDVSADGWDSSMVAYPCVVDTPKATFMFYSGNGFGAEGFGYAVLDR